MSNLNMNGYFINTTNYIKKIVEQSKFFSNANFIGENVDEYSIQDIILDDLSIEDYMEILEERKKGNTLQGNYEGYNNKTYTKTMEIIEGINGKLEISCKKNVANGSIELTVRDISKGVEESSNEERAKHLKLIITQLLIPEIKKIISLEPDLQQNTDSLTN